MRISTLQVFSAGLRNILNAQAGVSRTQAEVSSGKRVITPADDPPAASLALKIQQEEVLNDQFVRNSDVARRDLSLEEAQLESVENIMYRLRELAIQSGDIALSNQDRQAIIVEVNARRDELIGLFNTAAANGEFLFSGFQGQVQPFVQRTAGAVDYAGDEGQRFLQIAPGVDVEVRDNGKSLFVDIPSASNTFTTVGFSSNTGTGDISTGRIVDQAAYDAVYPDDLLITFNNPPTTYSVNRRNQVTNVQTPFLVAQPFTAGQTITIAGAEFKIVGTPAAADKFLVQASRTQSLISTVQRFVDGLNASPDTTAGSTERKRVIAETLNNLDLAEQQVIAGRSVIGSRQNVIDSTSEEQSAVGLINKQLLSDVTDLDYNEAISRLTFQNFVLQAAQQSFAKITSLSLFDFLR